MKKIIHSIIYLCFTFKVFPQSTSLIHEFAKGNNGYTIKVVKHQTFLNQKNLRTIKLFKGKYELVNYYLLPEKDTGIEFDSLYKSNMIAQSCTYVGEINYIFRYNDLIYISKPCTICSSLSVDNEKNECAKFKELFKNFLLKRNVSLR